MIANIPERAVEVRVRRHSGLSEREVTVAFRGREMLLRCHDYNQAVEWARIECKTYNVAGGFIVEP
jgi:hypothetical protein